MAAPVTTPQEEVIHLDLTTLAPEARADETFPPFTELPADREDAAPEKPDFLSNVTSRARDQVPGGDTEIPRLEGESEARGVQLDSGKNPSRPSAASPQQSTEAAGLEAAGKRSGAPKAGSESLERVSPDELRGTSGNSAFDQPAMARPDGNATFLGDVSLNTTAWEYAPWLQRFGLQLQERWFAPAAYRFGVLKEGGWALLEIEISKSGKVQRLRLLDEQGHPSLIRAAESALRSMNPIEPLPPDFPEPTLILRIRMIYPELRRR